jgi:hypothetical protein
MIILIYFKEIAAKFTIKMQKLRLLKVQNV